MATINYVLDVKKTLVHSNEGIVSSVDKETDERLKDNYTETIYFFRGAVLALVLALPFWSVLFWCVFT